MDINNILDKELTASIPNHTVVGIDIGSRQSKAVLLDNGQLYTALVPTGFFMQQTADELIDNLIGQAGISRKDIRFIVSTGYGRIALSFSDISNRLVTEISCHGMGAHYLNRNVRTIIDIGGQDSKAIRIDPESGRVEEFAMNDKCAAGTGRFLEKIAEVLGYDVTKIGEIALTSENPTSISSQCVVFAESEVISGRAKSEQVNDLAAGVNLSVARRVKALIGRVGLEKEILFTGGVSNNIGMRKAFEDLLDCKLVVPKLDTVYAGALGAAIFAAGYAEDENVADIKSNDSFTLSIDDIQNAANAYKEKFITHSTSSKLNVGYLCAYTPLEIMSAADVSFMRLMNAGTPKEVNAGENYTQSVFCDLTKSVIGGFETQNPLYSSVDRVYTFYACECMRKAAEVLNEKFVPTVIYNLPRKRTDIYSRAYFVGEVKAFKEELERVTGQKIDDESIRQRIVLYNRARKYLKEISDFRKAEHPLLTGSQYKKIVANYFSLPIDELLPQLESILEQLKTAKPSKGRKVRLLLAGGIAAQGDEKIVEILEDELGAFVVAEDNCTGMKPIYNQIPENGDVYQNLANGYLDQPPCFRMNPIEDAIKFSVNLAKEYNVDGIVYYYLKFCLAYAIMTREYIETFQKLGIPMLVISGDYSGGDVGQIRTRLEAFVEVLAERKD